MAARIALFLLIGLGLAGIAVTVFLGLRPAARVDATQPVAATIVVPMTQVLAASRTVRGGTLLLPDDVTSKPMPPGDVPGGAWVDNLDTRAATQGSMVRHQIETGQPILHDDIIRPGERGFLAAVLRPGSRAATIGVDAISGSAGLIWPGDHVDVILTQKLDDKSMPIGRRVVGETVLQDVRIIAVDQHLTEGVAPNTTLAAANITARTITIEVLARDAEKISVAETLGRLALVVRSAGDAVTPADSDRPLTEKRVTVAADRLVWSSDVSSAFRTPTQGQDATVHVFSGIQATPLEFHY